MMPGSSADNLAGTLPPDASTLVATAFNVGMINPDSFGKMQDDKVRQLAGHVAKWLEQGPAVVGLNEIAPSIAVKLVGKLNLHYEVRVATDGSNCGAPLLTYACPAWCLNAQRAVVCVCCARAARIANARRTRKHDALRRQDMLSLAGPVETPTYLPNQSRRRRTCLRVPLAQQSTARATTTWLVQLATSRRAAGRAPASWGRTPKKIQIFVLCAPQHGFRQASLRKRSHSPPQVRLHGPRDRPGLDGQGVRRETAT